MAGKNKANVKVVEFCGRPKRNKKPRKSGLNRNKLGSVRKINGKIYVDFMYLDERVRESSGLDWNDDNVKRVRQQLDAIAVAIDSGTFRFADVFPNSRKLVYFRQKERVLFNSKQTPEDVFFEDYAGVWYELLKASERVSERTLLGYRRYIELYLVPFFGSMSFGHLNKGVFDGFISWAKALQLRKKPVGNATINKIFVPMKMICKDVAIAHDWGAGYNPFFGFRKLPEADPYEKILPFSIQEQDRLVSQMSDHWKPYFQFAFSSGLRQGEQIGLKLRDIDWKKGLLKVRRAITLDEKGNIVEGKTKNRYSRRTIRLNASMLEPLTAQKEIHKRFKCEYFFCTSQGYRIHPSNLRQRVWLPALKKAGCEVREMKQTRHSFATVAIGCRENPLWVANVMGHRNTDMIIKVYSRYVEGENGTQDGTNLDRAFQAVLGNGG
jgi:integrase